MQLAQWIVAKISHSLRKFRIVSVGGAPFVQVAQFQRCAAHNFRKIDDYAKGRAFSIVHLVHCAKCPKTTRLILRIEKWAADFAACSQSSRLWGGFQGWDFRLHNAISLHVYTKGFCGASALRAWPKMPTGTSTVRQNRFLVSTHQNAPFRWIWRFISPFFFRVVIIMEFCAKLRIVVKIPSYSLCVCVLYTLNRR